MLAEGLIIAVTVAGTLDSSVEVWAKNTAVKPAARIQEKVEPKGEHDWLIKHPVILKVLELQNAERARHGLPPHRLNPDMCLDAQRHAVWMAETGYYQHSGLPYMEIIFQGPRSPEAAVQGWIHSSAHHSLMLSGTECGIGYMKLNGRTYWVGVFR